jgi:pimeloyl-ACP methyl ester carboxylesterase
MPRTVFLAGQLCTDVLWKHQREFADQILTLRDHDTMHDLARATFGVSPPRFSLAAHGMAGFVAFEMLRQQPERIERLVLISTLAAADTPKQTARREGYLLLVEQGRYDDIIEERIPMLVHPDRAMEAALTGDLRQMARDTGPEAFKRQQRAIMSRPDSRPGLRAITCPVLLIHGRADAIASWEHQQEMLDVLPDARLETVEDSGHMIPLERPKKVTAVLRDFLSA